MSRSPRFVLGFLALQACSPPDGAVDRDDGNADAPLPAAARVDLESGAALLPVQRFRAGSLLKTGVAVAVLQLVEAGAPSHARPANPGGPSLESASSRGPSSLRARCPRRATRFAMAARVAICRPSTSSWT
jgi:hypothetical protein